MNKLVAAALFGAVIVLGACDRAAVPSLSAAEASARRTIPAPDPSEEMATQLAAVREATRRFNDLERAVAEGYVPISPCVEVPGLGGMGIHYGKPATMDDADYVATEPEILLYAPQADGSLRLVAVEYWITEAAWQTAGKSGTPVFVDHPFDFDPANDHGLPNRYTLHIWNWFDNPSGIFAPFNPRVSCPPAEQHGHSAHGSHGS
jgi:hypothetical protein